MSIFTCHRERSVAIQEVIKPNLQLLGRRVAALLAMTVLAIAPLAAMAQAPVKTYGLSLIGALKLPPDYPYFPYVNPDAPKGGSVRLAAIGSFDSFNPFILRGVPAAAAMQSYDALMARSDDEAETSYCLICQDVEVAPDRLSVAFDLRPEARFWDGHPITSDDVIWTFETLLKDGRPLYRQYYADVASVSAEGPHRVVFRFRNADNRELPQILGEMQVLPKHWWAGRDFTTALSDPPLGSGPYRISAFEMGRSVTLERVKDYWAANLPPRRGQDNFDAIRTDYYRDATVALEAFKAGQVDWRTENLAKNWATAYDFPAVQQGLVRKLAFPSKLFSGLQGFGMNTRHPIFADRRVREAMILAFDFEWANKNLFYDSYKRTQSYFNDTDLASSGVPEGDELALLDKYRDKLPPELFTRPYTLPVTDGTGNNRPFLTQAFHLLEQAGWKVVDRKLVNARGDQFGFEILLDQPAFERVALPYAQDLEKLGINVTVRTVDPAQYEKLLDSFDYDMTVVSIGQSNSPGNEQRDFWSCASAKAQGSVNYMGVCDPVVDALIDAVIGAPDRAHLVTAVRALDRVLLWGDYVVPQWYQSEQHIAVWDRFGIPDKPTRMGADPMTWWIDPAKAARVDAARGGK
jgi:microcin C transport system substrate-binding protein